VRNGYLNQRMGYDLVPAARFAGLLLSLAPLHRRQARLSVRDLPFPAKEGRLLDIGCGNGSFLLEARRTGWDAIGVDPDAEGVAAARKRGLRVHLGTVADVLTLIEPFDAITMAHVLEHVPDPVETLTKCHALLRPGGKLWVATPNLNSRGRGRYTRDWRGLEPPRHLVLFTPEALKDVFESAGFTFKLIAPPRSGWMVQQSEALHLARIGGRPTRYPRWLRRAQLAATDLLNLLAPSRGEELIAMGTAVPREARFSGSGYATSTQVTAPGD
jgi:SAM-dependent methyltransferase